MDRQQVRQLILELLSESGAQTASSAPSSPTIPLQGLRSAPQATTSIPASLTELVPLPLRTAPSPGNSTEQRSAVFQPRSNTVQPYQGDQYCDAVNEEMSRLFAPYNSLGNVTNSRGIFNPAARISQIREDTPYSPSPRAGSYRGRATTEATGSIGADWSKGVLLLGDPSESHVPNNHREEELSAAYLRRGVIKSHRKATATQFMIDLDVTTASMEAEREEKLFSSVNWTLLYAKNKGTNQRLLHIYPEATPRVISTLQASSLYARPDIMLCPLSPESFCLEDVSTPAVALVSTPAMAAVTRPGMAAVTTLALAAFTTPALLDYC